MIFNRILMPALALALTAAFVPSTGARAELILSQLVVELQPGKVARQDIEAQNNGADILYVAVAPREVIDAGTSRTSSREDPDPEKLGLLVSPARMVLDPGKRKLLRIAAVTGFLDRERVYRVTVKPVVGKLSSEKAGLKILLGYEVLVLVRPSAPQVQISGIRLGKSLTLRNTGNASVELTNGEQCDERGKICQQLPGGRLYAGAEKVISIEPQRSVSYVFKQGMRLVPMQF